MESDNSLFSVGKYSISEGSQFLTKYQSMMYLHYIFDVLSSCKIDNVFTYAKFNPYLDSRTNQFDIDNEYGSDFYGSFPMITEYNDGTLYKVTISISDTDNENSFTVLINNVVLKYGDNKSHIMTIPTLWSLLDNTGNVYPKDTLIKNIVYFYIQLHLAIIAFGGNTPDNAISTLIHTADSKFQQLIGHCKNAKFRKLIDELSYASTTEDASKIDFSFSFNQSAQESIGAEFSFSQTTITRKTAREWLKRIFGDGNCDITNSSRKNLRYAYRDGVYVEREFTDETQKFLVSRYDSEGIEVNSPKKYVLYIAGITDEEIMDYDKRYRSVIVKIGDDAYRLLEIFQQLNAVLYGNYASANVPFAYSIGNTGYDPIQPEIHIEQKPEIPITPVVDTDPEAQHGSTTDFAPRRTDADFFFGEIPCVLSLAINKGTKNAPDWQWAVLNDDTEIHIEHINPLWDKNATATFSHSITLNAEENIHIIGTAATMYGPRLFDAMYGKEFRLYYAGSPILYGVVHLDNEVSVENGEFDIELASGNTEFEDDIEDMNCRDVIPLSTAYTDSLGMGREITQTYGKKKDCKIKRLVLGSTITQLDVEGDVYDVDEKHGSDRFKNVKDDASGSHIAYKGPHVTFAPRAMDQLSFMDFKNVDIASKKTYKDGFPYCFIRKCWKKYRYQDDDSDGKYEWKAVTPRQYQSTDQVTKYSDKHYFTTSFYVAYFLEMLFKQMEYTLSQNDMEDIEDWWRLAFTNGTTGISHGANDTNLIGCDNHNRKHISSFSRLISTKNRYNYYGITFTDNPNGAISYNNNNKDLYGGIHVDTSLENSLFTCGNDFDGAGVWINQSDPNDNFYTYGEIAGVHFIATVRDAFANGSNFPESDIKSVIEALENAFNLRFLFSSKYKTVRIVSINKVLSENNVIHHIEGNVCGVGRQDTGVSGFRLMYSGSDVKAEQSYNNELTKYEGDANDAHYNYTNFHNVELNENWADIKKAISSSDSRPHIDKQTGNAYTIRVDEDAKSTSELNASWFETAENIPAEYGDCSDEASRLGRIEEVSINFTPVVMNPIDVDKTTNGVKYGLFVDEEIHMHDGEEENKVQVLVQDMKIDAEVELPKKYNVTYKEFKRIYTPIGNETRTSTPKATLGYAYNERVSFDHSSSDDKHPLLNQDYGFTLGIMRGPGNSGTDNATHIQDSEGNTEYSVQTCHYGNFHADIIDQEGRLFDYNGDDQGIGGAFGNNQKVVYREDIAYYLELFGCGTRAGSVFNSDHANMLAAPRFACIAEGAYIDGEGFTATYYNDYIVCYTKIASIGGQNVIVTPIKNDGSMFATYAAFNAEVLRLSAMSLSNALANDTNKIIVTTDGREEVQTFIHNIVNLYAISTRKTQKMSVPSLSKTIVNTSEANDTLQTLMNTEKSIEGLVYNGDRILCREDSYYANSAHSDEYGKMSSWSVSGCLYVPIYYTTKNEGKDYMLIFSGFNSSNTLLSKEELLTEVTRCINTMTISEMQSSFSNLIGVLPITSSDANYLQDMRIYIMELIACAQGKAKYHRSFYDIQRHSELDGRISLKLKAEKPVYSKEQEAMVAKGVAHWEDNGNGTKKAYFNITSKTAQNRGLFDKFYKNYADFVVSRKIAIFDYSSINLTTLTDLNDELLYEIQGVTGFIKQYSYKLSNKGVRDAQIQLYYK